MVLNDGVIGSVMLTPGGLTVITKEDALKQFVTQGKFTDSRIREEDLRQSIKEVFHADLVKFLPPVEKSRQMTAYEVSQRAELVRLLGPAFGNLTDFWLDPMIENGFYMMYRAGAFPPPPDSIREMARSGKQTFKIEYEGPLAKAQRAGEIEALVKTMQVLSPLADMNPQIMDNFDFDEIAQVVALINGVPKKIMRGKEGPTGIKSMRLAREKAALERQTMEQAASAAEIAGKAGPVVKQLGGPDAIKRLLGAAGANA
jgi:hypothetical protein